ncbi:RepA [Mastrevirus sp.]|nr:RepA [Mastrevirus sp.]
MSSNSAQSGPSNFRFRAQNVFLTYPQCNIDPMDAANMLRDRFSTHFPKYILVTRELHSDGHYHLHCLLQLDRPLSSNNSRIFDLSDHHPNIQAALSVKSVRNYCLKNPITQYQIGKFVPAKGGRKLGSKFEDNARNKIMRNIISTSTTRDDYLTMVRKSFPFEWATKLNQFEYSASKLFPEVTPEYKSPFPTESLLCNENIQDWVDNTLYQVSPSAYSMLHPHSSATSDLIWLHQTSNTLKDQHENWVSTFADQQEQERLPGQEV